MSSQGVLYVEIVPSTRGFGKGIEGDAKKAFNSASKDGSGFFSRMGKMAKGLGIAIGGAVTLVGGLAVKGGISRALAIEDATAKLKGLGNDTDTIRAIMDNALASVKGTAFGLGEAATTAAGAVAAGIKPGKELEGVLKTVANTAAATGTTMEEMGSIFNSVATTGRAYTDDIQKIADRGLPMWQKLAEQLGVTEDEVRKMATQGKINFEMFEEAARDAAGTVADEMGNTTRGAFDNMMAALGRLGEMLIGGPLPRVKDVFREINEIIDIFNEKILQGVFGLQAPDWLGEMEEGAKHFDGLSDSAEKLIDKLAGALQEIDSFGSSIGDTLGPVVDFFRPILEVIQDIAPKVWEVFTALSPLSNLFKVLEPVLPTIVDAFSGLADALGGGLSGLLEIIAGLIETLANAVLDLAPTLGEIGAVVADVLAGALESLMPTLETIVDVFGGLVEILIPVIDNVLQLVEPLLRLLDPIQRLASVLLPPLIEFLVMLLEPIVFLADLFLSALIPAIEFVIDVLAGLLDLVVTGIEIFAALLTGQMELEEVLPAIWDAILGFLSDIWASLEETASQIWENMKRKVMEIFESVAEWLGLKWDDIKGDVSAKIDQMKADLAQKWEDIKAAVVEKWNDIVAWFKDIPQKLKDAIARVKELKDDMKGYIQGVKDGAVEKWNDIVSWFKDLPTKIKNAVGDLGSTLKQAGRDVLNGFWEGLKSVWESVKGWFSDITSSIPKLKGPPERDIKLLADAGDLTMQGYLDGLRKRFPDVEAALGGLTDMIPGFAGVPAAASAGGSAADSSVDVLARLADVLENLPEDIRAGLLALFEVQAGRSQRDGRVR